MAKEHLIALKKYAKAQELAGWLCEHGASVVKITGVAIFLTLTPELLNAATKVQVKAFLDGKDGIAPGQKDSIQFTGSEYRYLYHGDINQQDGQGVQLFTDGVPVPFNDANAVGPGSRIKIVGVEGSGIDDFNVGRGQGESGDIVSGVATPLTRLSIDAYVKEGKIRVDAEIAQARNVDRIEMQAGLSPEALAVVDSKKVENGEAPQTFNFEMPIDEFIKQHNITSPTVVYVRLESHDNDGLTQKSRLQSVVIHPDEKINHITVFPNPASASDIRFMLPGDVQSEHLVQIIHSDGRLILQTRLSAGEHQLADLCSHIHSGIYYIRTIGDASNNDHILHQKFSILP